ncbi:MAG TPA: YerC/YecD family TrpR-related protein [Patescibacteria group bacterium]|nr:YerC/YecD family TrpR-related protein [Patescibacteria group bacterium]
MDIINTSEAKELYKAIMSLQTLGETKKFLRDLLTEPEIKEFSNRWKVARMLDEKISYEEIERQTGMSSTTIARIQKWLNGPVKGYKNMLKKTKQNKNVAHHTF